MPDEEIEAHLARVELHVNHAALVLNLPLGDLPPEKRQALVASLEVGELYALFRRRNPK